MPPCLTIALTGVWVGWYGMTVGGKSVDYLRKPRTEARRAGRLLARATRIEVPVQPAIVFTGARRLRYAGAGRPMWPSSLHRAPCGRPTPWRSCLW